MVEKILLVGTPPLEQRYVAAIDEGRLERFTADQRREWREITSSLAAAHPQEGFVVRLAELAAVADNFDPIPDERNAVDVRPDLFRAVWHEAAEMRRDGSLLATVRQIRCPVVAIHGEDDPHPAAGVQGPLATALGAGIFHGSSGRLNGGFTIFSTQKSGGAPLPSERRKRDYCSFS
jgi:pimeloyl-ACP methyl ester carboxylesterase